MSGGKHDSSPDQNLPTRSVANFVDLTGISLHQNSGLVGAAGAVPSNDKAGNLILDGSYCPQYNAWSPMIHLNEASQDGVGQVIMGD